MTVVTMAEGLMPRPGEKKDSGIARALYVQMQGRPVWSDRNYESFAREGYIQNAIVFRCIRLIVEAAKSIPLLVYSKGQPVEGHEFLDLIARPNPFVPQADLLDQLYSYLMIAGNSYMEAVIMGKKPTELYVLRPDRMSVEVSPRGYPSAYVYKVGDQVVRYSQPDPGKQRTIMHLKNFHPTNDLYGLSMIEPAARAIDTHNAAGSYNASLLQNMGRPSGALSYDGGDDNVLTQDQFDRLKQQMTEQMQGPSAAGKPMLLEGGLKWVPFSQTSQDMEFSEGKSSAARDIALAAGVPPQILGIPGDNTYSNLKEANVAFYRQTVLPFIGKVCQNLSLFFTPTYGEDFQVWYDIDEVVGLTFEREEKWNMVNMSTILTVNEKREAIGYDERPEGDVVLISSSMVPLDMELEDEDTSEESDSNADPSDPDEEGEEVDDGSSTGGGDESEQDEGNSKD